jgi:hypothetical protein
MTREEEVARNAEMRAREQEAKKRKTRVLVSKISHDILCAL